MSKRDFPFSRVPDPKKDEQPRMLAELLPRNDNDIPIFVVAIYDRIRRPGLPYFVRARMMPKLAPVYSLFDSDLGIVTPPEDRNPRARYNQSVFGRLQRGSDIAGSKILARIYAVTNIVARDLAGHANVSEYVESGKDFQPDLEAVDVRRTGWRAASRLAIEVVVSDKNRQDKITRHMRVVEDELEYQAFGYALAGIDDIQQIDPNSRKSFAMPVELSGSVLPLSEDELQEIFPKKR